MLQHNNHTSNVNFDTIEYIKNASCLQVAAVHNYKLQLPQEYDFRVCDEHCKNKLSSALLNEI